MFLRTVQHIRPSILAALSMTRPFSSGAALGGVNGSASSGVSLRDLPKSNVFTTSLPADPEFPSPSASHAAPREKLGPRMVKGALYTFVRPEGVQEPELLAVSHAAMKDIGLKDGEEKTQEFKELVAGNRILWDERTREGIYPWAQCYGGVHLSRP